MKLTGLRRRRWEAGRASAIALAGLVLALTQLGCVAVGYRSGGGWFIWPGGLGLLVMVLLALLLLRRR